MAYSDELADRVRAALGDRATLGERKMFGGLAFMHNGHMFSGVLGEQLIVRLGPEAGERALEQPHTAPMDFTGRPLKGYVYVAGRVEERRRHPTLARAGDRVRRVAPTEVTTLEVIRMEQEVDRTREQPRRSFSPALFGFLSELRENNDREWFKANKRRYEEAVQEPALEFIADFAPLLRGISPHFVADPRAVGGSLFRIYRDTRFGKDKTPYKTHTGIQFRHEQARDVHAPAFYLHLEPGQVFAGAGIWRPDSPTLAKIREAMAAEPERWTAAVRESLLGKMLRFEGESLKRPPAGYDPAHPVIEDLKRKDFIAVAKLSQKTVTSTGFAEALADTFRGSAPLMRFLCKATGVAF